MPKIKFPYWFFGLFIFTMQNEHSMRIWSKTPWKKLVFWKMAKIAQNHHFKFSKIILLLKTDYLETMKWFCHKKPNHGCFRQLYAAFSEIFWKIWKNLKSANSLAVVTWAKFYSTHQTIFGVCLISHRRIGSGSKKVRSLHFRAVDWSSPSYGLV